MRQSATGFFTILANLLGAAALAVAAVAALSGMADRWVDGLRGVATLSLAVTGPVYVTLLGGAAVGPGETWTNVLLHRAMPVVMVLDWLLAPPHGRVGPARALRWLAFPLAYCAYTLARGARTGHYPYPFLDPRPGGYGQVALTVAVLLVATGGLAVLIAWAGSRRAAVRHRGEP